MREEEEEEEEEEEGGRWFSRWEEELPSLEELTPLSQTLITPDLALAFDIPPSPTTAAAAAAPPLPSTDSDSADPDGDEPARTVRRPRLVWTPQLHKRFVDAVAHLGIKNAVPKAIMQLMTVEGLTRENVASHLQKYRLYLKRIHLGPTSPSPSPSSAADRLFATAPIPHHFLRGAWGGGGAAGGPAPPPPMPFLPSVAAALHHHQKMVLLQQQQHYLGVGVLATGQPPLSVMHNRMGPPVPGDLEEGGGRKMLTLFPTGEDR